MESLRQITNDQGWRNEAQRILLEVSLDSNFISEFHTHWTEEGHHIRTQIKDDKLLVNLLRKVLPQYDGGTLILFRGENLDRWNSDRVGLCWTSQIAIAEMFGGGLNAIGSGGVLLQASFNPSSIISGPSGHSSYLGEEEFTIDPFKAECILALERYPPSS